MAIAARLIEPLGIAIGRVFRPPELDLVMLRTTGDGLFQWVPRGLSDRQTAIDLVQVVSEADLETIVLADILARRPGNAALRALVAQAAPGALAAQVEEMPLSAQHGGEPIPDPNLSNAFAPGLQRNVRPHLAKLDLMVWVERLMQVKNRVCRIEISGRATGTGFLVGPEAVLTNWHVVEKAHAAGTLGTSKCRFDYVRLPDGTRRPGVEVGLHADGLVDWAPYGAAEATDHPDDPPPTQDELDYALLRLADAAGEHPVDGGRRGWLTLAATPFPLAADDPLLIVQHPDGAPMKLAMDTQAVIGLNANGTRVRYRTNTEPGSSGSPCFSMEWDLVALHHYGEVARFNQGVPIDLIGRRIRTGRNAALLGP
ncbi:serine protease [Shinella sp. S4-D37]|uniref:trypsin-like serine peptidase n=1 Tax=Shinella sp. S4-D37 TaxID=3161999 RepID=UPI003465EEE2